MFPAPFISLISVSVLFLMVSTLHAQTLTISNPALISDVHEEIHASLDAFIATEPVSVKEFFDDWNGHYSPKSGTNLALASVRMSVGGGMGPWRLSYLHRLETMVVASRDLVDLVHSDKQNENLKIGRDYRLDLSVRGFEADGIELARRVDLLDQSGFVLKGGLAISLLHGKKLQSGSAIGTAQALSATDYNYNGIIDYYYSRNYLYDNTMEVPQGYGATVDLGLQAVWNGRWLVEAAANDFGFIRWSDAPYTNATITSATKAYDENGYVRYNPTITGLEIYRNMTQSLDPKYFLKTQYLGSTISPFVQLTSTRGYFFPELGTSIALTPTSSLTAFYETRFGTTGLRYTGHYGYISLQSDTLGLSNASAAALMCGFSYAF